MDSPTLRRSDHYTFNYPNKGADMLNAIYLSTYLSTYLPFYLPTYLPK